MMNDLQPYQMQPLAEMSGGFFYMRGLRTYAQRFARLKPATGLHPRNMRNMRSEVPYKCIYTHFYIIIILKYISY